MIGPLCGTATRWRTIVQLLALTGTLGLCACSSLSNRPEPGAASEFGKDASTAATGSLKSGIGSAVTTPLADLNLRRAPIPAVLSALKTPYDPFIAETCSELGELVTALDQVLGPDSDAPDEDKQRLGEKAGNSAAGYALGAISDASGDLVPLRSILRSATGAKRRESRLQSAYDRGVARRAYLKGVGTQMRCKPPAAPRPSEPTPNAIP